MRKYVGWVVIAGALVVGTAVQGQAQFSLPTLTVTDCSAPDVAISTTDAGGTLGFDIDISFNSAVLAVDGVDLGTLTPPSPDCEFAYNDTNPGVVMISIACTTPISGSGSVAVVHFVPVGEGSSSLTFSRCDIDEEPCGSATAGSVSISGCPTIDLSNGGSGAFGRSPGRACVVGTLVPDASTIASSRTDMGFNSSVLTLETCAINPSLVSLGKSLTRTTLGPGSERITVSGGMTSIPSGHLFVCRFAIAASVTGPLAIVNASVATSSGGVALPTTGQYGSIGIATCVGDCDGNKSVVIGEVVKALNAFGGSYLCSAADPSASCPAADGDNSGAIAINDVVQTLNQFGAGPCP